MSDFAIRFGYAQPAVDVDEAELPITLKNGVWDALNEFFFKEIYNRNSAYGSISSKQFSSLCKLIWFNFYKEPTDKIPNSAGDALAFIRGRFFNYEYIYFYSFLEFLAGLDLSGDPFWGRYGGRGFVEICNKLFERERIVFRFSGNLLVKITGESDIAALNDATSQKESLAVAKHIKRAAELMSHRPEPDFRNSIKESISAVEAAVSYTIGKKSFGIKGPLRQVSEDLGLHPALRDGFEKLYAYTSDEDGIRHALLDKKDLYYEDARYMLISCSAFSNYLIGLKIKKKS